jgi:signal transduction histidine kinase
MTRPRLHVHSAITEQVDAERRIADLPPLPLSPSRKQPGTVDERIWRALHRASQTVAASHERIVFGDIPARNDASGLQMLCAAIQAAARGATVSVRDLPQGTSDELLPPLRRAFLEELAHAGETLRPVELVHVMRAVETVADALEKRDVRSGASLTEEDGRTLVVEVAHDMRSPLAAILFLVETITNERSGPLLAAQQRQLGLVYSAAFALSTLTNDLIEFARGGGSLLAGAPVPFSITGVLCGVRDIILPIAEEKGLSLTLTPPDADWRVGQAPALHRVLLNLSTNALKFTDEGCVEVTARQLSRTSIEFSVSDTGRGMPANVVQSIREPESPIGELGSRGFCSAGLGLSICRKLVAGMGGELRAETTPGQGSRLYFTIDLALAPRL